jgi:hypothetical protein
MTSPMPPVGSQGGDLVQRWRSFWFSTEPAYTLGLVRIGFGALAVLWTLELFPDLYERFGSKGFVPKSPSEPYLWSLFQFYGSDSELLIGWLVLLVAAIALTVGWHSRLAAIVVFVLVLSFERRDPWIFNAGDGLIRIEALFLALSSCGAALSIDQRRRTGSFWSAQKRPVWPLRLMQIQVSIVYLCTVVAKLRGDTWQNGTAVSYSLRLQDMLILPTPDWLAENPLMANVTTWGTLLIELSIALFVWNKKWRMKVLAAGFVLHLSIMLTMAVGFFSPAIFVLYLAFVPTSRAKAIANSVEGRLAKLQALIRPSQRDHDTVDDDTDAKPAEASAVPALKVDVIPDPVRLDLDVPTDLVGPEERRALTTNGRHDGLHRSMPRLDAAARQAGRHSRREPNDREHLLSQGGRST